MNERYITCIVLRGYPSSTWYSERDTARASHLSVDTIRRLRALGLIEGKHIDGEWCYNGEDIVQLRRIRRLHHDLGINLAGVEVILRLLKRLDALQHEHG